MHDIENPGFLTTLEEVYRRSFLHRHSLKDRLLKPLALKAIRMAERVSGLDTSPVHPLPQRMAMLSRVADRHIIRLVARLVPPGGVFWDIGANIGYISRSVAALRNDVQVHAFEPNPEIVPVLRSNLDGRNVHPIALGAMDGNMALYVGNYCVVASQSKEWVKRHDVPGAGIREHRVEVRRGDSLVASGACPPPDTIKIDVEGHELDVLAGLRNRMMAAESLSLVCEFCPVAMAKAGHEPMQLFDLLKSARFHVWYIRRSGAPVPLDTPGQFDECRESIGSNYGNILAVKGDASAVIKRDGTHKD